MPSYLGQAPGLGRQEFFHFTATASQTTFTGTDDNGFALSYTPGQIVVFLDGVMQDPADYTASNGTSVVLASGATAGQLLSVLAFGAWSPADALSKASGGSVVGALLNPGRRHIVGRRSTTAGGAIPTGSWTTVNFETVVANTETDFSVSGANTAGYHWTVPSGVSLIRITTNVQFNTSVSNNLRIIDHSGADRAYVQSNASASLALDSGILPVSAGDDFRIEAFQGSGAAVDLLIHSFLSIEIIG